MLPSPEYYVELADSWRQALFVGTWMFCNQYSLCHINTDMMYICWFIVYICREMQQPSQSTYSSARGRPTFKIDWVSLHCQKHLPAKYWACFIMRGVL